MLLPGAAGQRHKPFRQHAVVLWANTHRGPETWLWLALSYHMKSLAIPGPKIRTCTGRVDVVLLFMFGPSNHCGFVAGTGRDGGFALQA